MNAADQDGHHTDPDNVDFGEEMFIAADDEEKGEAALKAECSVCGSPAAAHLHYGAISCYSCRAFFRRGPPRQARCIYGNDECKITRFNRTNCKQCRYTRCLTVGMLPDKVDATLKKKKEKSNKSTAESTGLPLEPEPVIKHTKPNRTPASESMEVGEKVSSVAPRLLKNEMRRLSSYPDTEVEIIRSPCNPISSTNPRFGLPRQVHAGHPNLEVDRMIISRFEREGGGRSDGHQSRWMSMEKENEMIPHAQHFPWVGRDIPVQSWGQPCHSQAQATGFMGNGGWSGNTNLHTATSYPAFDKLQQSLNNIPSIQNLAYIEHINRLKPDCFRGVRDFDIHQSAGVQVQPSAFENYLQRFETRYESSPTARFSPPRELQRPYVNNEQKYIDARHFARSMEPPSEDRGPRYPNKVPMTESTSSAWFAEQAEGNGVVPDLQTLARFDYDPSLQQVQSTFDFGTPAMEMLDDLPLLNKSLEESSDSGFPHVVPELSKHKVDERREVLHKVVDFRMTKLVPSTPPDPPHYKKTWSETNIQMQTQATDTENDLSRAEQSYRTQDVPATAVIVKAGRKRCLEAEDWKSETDSYSHNKGSPVPLKKRPRMYQLAYPIGHGINKSAIPVLTFTFEEQFKVMDYIVRIEEYQNLRFEFLRKSFRHYEELLVSYVKCTSLGCKIPFSKEIEKTLFNIGLEFTKSNTDKIFVEMGSLSTEVRRMVLNSTYPALYVVFYSILEGNTRESTWVDQHRKTLHITEMNHSATQKLSEGLTHVRAISLQDQERFTSPWARDRMDEEKFEKVVSTVGRILRDDKHLQALYHMLVMMTPSVHTPLEIQSNPDLQRVQVDLVQLIYRYLSTALAERKPDISYINCIQESAVMRLSSRVEGLDAAQTTYLLISLIGDLHDCADIMQFRSLPGRTELNTLSDI